MANSINCIFFNSSSPSAYTHINNNSSLNHNRPRKHPLFIKHKPPKFGDCQSMEAQILPCSLGMKTDPHFLEAAILSLTEWQSVTLTFYASETCVAILHVDRWDNFCRTFPHDLILLQFTPALRVTIIYPVLYSRDLDLDLMTYKNRPTRPWPKAPRF